jgi:nicotinamidase-related amidase
LTRVGIVPASGGDRADDAGEQDEPRHFLNPHNVDSLILAGLATSGAVLSTL